MKNFFKKFQPLPSSLSPLNLFKRKSLPSPLSPLTSPGFTLIELLTVIGIFAVIGTLSVSIITLTLRGTKKAELFRTMRENGNLALAQVTRSIRYAKSLDDPISCTPAVSVQSVTITSISDNSQMEFICLDTTITANGSPLLDPNAATVKNCSFTCSQQAGNSSPTVTLQFSLLPQGLNNFTETNVPVDFQTTVVMRNYNNR